jgi:membrane-bound ClpP family serine protease
MAEITPQAAQAAANLGAAKNADVFLFSHAIDRSNATLFSKRVTSINPRKDNAILLIATNGGDPDGAYIITRCLQRNYKKLTTMVFGRCKSAGTLVVVGANEVVMSDSGELGPLDIQVNKDDELFVRSSGLDINEAIKFLKDLAAELFVRQLVNLKSGTSITTRTAAEIAQGLAIGVISPIASQIDPLKLGEMQRAMRIVRDYGTRLTPNNCDLERLITAFPSHSFVIDREDAGTIFKNVRKPDVAELELATALGDLVITQDDKIEWLTPPPVPPAGNPPP